MRDLPRRQFVLELLAGLQAQNQLNANIVLYCVWFALTEQGRLRRPEFKKLQAVLHPWHERIVEGLQQLGDSLSQHRSLQLLVADETDIANQFEQQMLAQAITSVKKSKRNCQQQLIDASHNLATYYKLMRIHTDDTLKQSTSEILRLFFVDCSDLQITATLNQALNAAHIDDGGFTQLSLV